MLIRSASHFKTLVPMLKLARAQELWPGLGKVIKQCDLDSVPKLAMFLAQTGHESYSYRFVKELWGPSPQQLRYEPVTSLSKKLGNTEPGDGFKFRGRGWIQLTGRNNYKNAGADLGLDLVNKPELAETLEGAFAVTGWYWNKNKLNRFCNDIKACTKAINGGYLGLEDRQRRYEIAETGLRAKA